MNLAYNINEKKSNITLQKHTIKKIAKLNKDKNFQIQKINEINSRNNKKIRKRFV